MKGVFADLCLLIVYIFIIQDFFLHFTAYYYYVSIVVWQLENVYVLWEDLLLVYKVGRAARQDGVGPCDYILKNLLTRSFGPGPQFSESFYFRQCG